MQDSHSDFSRVAQHALVLGNGSYVNPNPNVPAHFADSTLQSDSTQESVDPKGAPPIKSIANFLLDLFQEREIQPSTIDGYRSATADKLRNWSINVSKDENLTRLMDSFHRDRP